MKFNPGDKVICNESHEIQQPMEIVGLNKWFTSDNVLVYYVKGKHKKNGNDLTVSLTEGIIYSALSSNG